VTIRLDDSTSTRTDFRRRGQFKVPVVRDPETGKDTTYGRPSSHGKWIEDSYGLQLWGKRMVAVGVATTPSLIARVASLDPADEANKKALNEACEAALVAAKGNEAADVGTALHHITERVDRGELAVPDVPELFRADVEALLAAREAAGLTVVEGMIEVHCVCDDLRLAGTFDRILTDGSVLYSSDLKTGKDPARSQLTYAVQAAIYSRSLRYDVATDQRHELPPVDQDLAIIEHLPAGHGTCTIYAIDITAGWELAQLAAVVKKQSKRKGLLVTFEQRHKLHTIEGGGAAGTATQDAATTPSTSVEPSPPRAPDQPAAVVPCPAAAGDPVPVATALDAVMHQTRVAWIMNRIDALVANPAAAPWLGQLWPATVPRPKETPGGPGAWTTEQLTAVIRCVDQVEAQVEAPFGDQDPAVAAAQRAELDRRAEASVPVVHRLTAPDDGPVIAEPTDVDWQRQVMRQMTVEQQEEVLQWIRDAQAAGVPWAMSPAGQPTPLRRLEIARAALELAQLDGHTPGDDTGPRAALTLVIGEDAQQPVHRVGGLLGTLTTEQACQLAKLAETHRLTVREDGQPRLEVVA